MKGFFRTRISPVALCTYFSTPLATRTAFHDFKKLPMLRKNFCKTMDQWSSTTNQSVYCFGNLGHNYRRK
jgi:hypothetical protein